MKKIEERPNRRTHCLVCGRRLPESALLEFDGMPASAQNIPDAEEVEKDRGMDLSLYQCRHCGLVQFDCEPVDYYRDVIRSGGFSTTMVELRRSQYRHLIEKYGLEGKKLVEAGCGQGEFLKVLTEFPVQAYGVEHRADLVRKAREQGLCVTEGFTETPDTRLGENGPYDGFLSFNFLEHQPEPGVMLDCIRANVKDGGIGLITVPSLEYILKYDGYYELIRDHIAYYSFETLRNLLELHGFEVLEEEMVNRDTCSVIVRKLADGAGETGRESESEIGGTGRESEAGNAREPRVGSRTMTPADVSALAASRSRIEGELEELTGRLEAEGKTFAIWGASHQGFTLAATTCLGRKAAYIIDSAPFKQGRFAPASHLLIAPPEHFYTHPVEMILIVAPGYTREIADSIRSRFGDRVEIMTLRSDHLETLDAEGDTKI